MKNPKYTGLVWPFILSVVLILAIFGLLSDAPTLAAPPAAPTPIADLLIPGVQPSAFTIQAATAIAADTNTTGIDVMRLGVVDIQYIIDHGTVNTTTLTPQYSNDNTNWVSGAALVSASAADGTSITRVPVFGRYLRVNQDVATTDTVTVTLLAVGR